jgi:TPR repeat protein
MADENLKPSPPVDEKVIDTCLELLAAGRPLSEIMVEAKRRSTVSLDHPPFAPPEADQAISAEKANTEPLMDTAGNAPRKLPVRSLLAASALLSVLADTAATAYLVRVMPESSTTERHSEATNETASMRVALSPTANTEIELTASEDKLTPIEIKKLVERGTMLVGSGDLPSARRLYERAVEAGDPQAAIYLGETYDPAFLKRARFGKNARGHLDSAVYWYRRARDLGSSEADEMLKRLATSSGN